MTDIEVFADIACPFTHVGLRRLVEARDARSAGTEIRVRAWPLEWINGRPLDPDLVAREIAALRAHVAPEMFAGFDAAKFPRTSLPAFGLVAAAYARDDARGVTASLAVRDALFERGLDIADPEVIRALAEMLDVEPLAPESAQTSVRADWERGKNRGVLGSPHFFVGKVGWFCPTLRVHHDDGAFDVQSAQESTREFYAAAFG